MPSKKKKPLSAEAIKLLKRDGLVEGCGKNIFISKYVALATNQEKEHSQAKGLSVSFPIIVSFGKRADNYF